jgi:hypothetical protein
MTEASVHVVSRDRKPRDGMRIDAEGVPRYENPPASLVAMLRERADELPLVEAVVELGGERATYRQLWDRSTRVAGGLRAWGDNGDRVAIRYAAGGNWVLAFWGTLVADWLGRQLPASRDAVRAATAGGRLGPVSPAISGRSDPCPCSDVVCQRDEVIHSLVNRNAGFGTVAWILLRPAQDSFGDNGDLVGQPGTPLRVRVKQVPQTPLTRLTFEILDNLRVMMRVPRLAHLGVIHRLGRIHVRLHEVQQLRPIPLSSTRGLE